VRTQPDFAGAREEEIVAEETRDKQPQKIQIQQHTFMGCVWFGAWLFTIGFLHLSFWKSLWALIVWPYYLGDHFSALFH